jgi:hypothetical protein
LRTVDFAPRALLGRSLIKVKLALCELSLLVEALEARGCRCAGDLETVDVAQHWFDRVAEFREAGR